MTARALASVRRCRRRRARCAARPAAAQVMPLPPDSPAPEVKPPPAPAAGDARAAARSPGQPVAAAAAAPARAADPRHADAAAARATAPRRASTGTAPSGTRSRPSALQSRWRSRALRLRRAERDARLDAELRPVVEQRDAGAARDVRGPARAHADHRQQLAVRRADGGAPVRRPARHRPRSRWTSSASSRPTRPSRRSTRRPPCACACSTCALKAKLGWDSSLDLLAGQYHDLFAWGGAGFYPHSVAFLGIAGEVYHRNPQMRLTWSVPLCCVTIDVAAAAVRPVQRDSEVPDVQAGIRGCTVDRWRGIGAQGFGQPDIAAARDRRLGRLAPLRGRRVPARARRAQDRLRLRLRGERVRPGHPRALRAAIATTRCR